MTCMVIIQSEENILHIKANHIYFWKCRVKSLKFCHKDKFTRSFCICRREFNTFQPSQIDVYISLRGSVTVVSCFHWNLTDLWFDQILFLGFKCVIDGVVIGFCLNYSLVSVLKTLLYFVICVWHFDTTTKSDTDEYLIFF